MYYPGATAEALQDLISAETVKKGRRPTYNDYLKESKIKQAQRFPVPLFVDYATDRKDKSMSVKNLVAISEYFDVSIDFLLGKSFNRKVKNVNIGKRTGLKDEAIKVLEAFNSSQIGRAHV